MMRIRTWFRPEPQPQQFIGTVSAGLSFLPYLVVALPVAWVAYTAGQWVGDGRGYSRAMAKVQAVTDEKNRRITELNDELDAAHTLAEGKREESSGKVFKSLSEFSPKLRQECSTKCSMPASARANLEAIDP